MKNYLDEFLNKRYSWKEAVLIILGIIGIVQLIELILRVDITFYIGSIFLVIGIYGYARIILTKLKKKKVNKRGLN